ncbi:MAG: hypothetical protein Q7S28_03245 [bacterium]|nr:hypothetical protein [bacterium]
MAEDTTRYKELLSEIIAKQAVILGPEIAVLKARSIFGLKVADDGAVTEFSGDPNEILEKLVDAYVDLSGQIVKSALTSVFKKYPEIKGVE